MLDRCRVTPEGFVWLLGAACQLYRQPFDPATLLKQSPLPNTLSGLRAALEKFGFRSAIAALDGNGLQRLSCPCFALVPAQPHRLPADGSLPTMAAKVPDHASQADIPADFVLLLKAEGDRVVYLAPDDSKPRETTVASFLADGLGLFLQFGRTERMSATAGAGAGADARTVRFSLAWFLGELRKYQAAWRTVLLASLAIQIVGLAAPLFTLQIVDQVVAWQTPGALVVIGCTLAFCIVFTAVVNWLRQYLVMHTGTRIDGVLANQVFHHLLRLPLSFFETRLSGNLLSRLHGIETIREFVSGGAMTLLFDLPFLLIFLLAMFWLSWQLALLALVPISLLVLLSALVMPLFRDHLNRQFLLGARNQSFLSEYLSGMATVKMLQMDAYVEKRHGDYLASYLAASFGSRQAGSSFAIVAVALEQSMMLAILIAGTMMVVKNNGFTLGMLAASLMLCNRIGQPMMRLLGFWQRFQRASIAIERLGEILDQRVEACCTLPARESTTAARIDLVDIGFRYSDEQAWLYRHLNLVFQAGRITVLKGPPGSGKSTLSKLVQGGYQPEQGQIHLDGCDIRQVSASELRATFAVVSQENVLFSGTLYDNLVMAHPHASFEDVIRACKAAEIHDVIDKLPDGYRTELGERGIGLSHSQKQRLALARALLRRPRVLILDDVLAHLDTETAERLTRTINNLQGKMTVIYMAYRSPPGLQVDAVIDLAADDGLPATTVDPYKPTRPKPGHI